MCGAEADLDRVVTRMNDEDFTISSDNVFADLGMPNAEELLIQARLLTSIVMEITRRGLTRHQVAILLDIPQIQVSHLLKAHLSRFSLESLQQMSTKLGMHAAISH